MLFRSMQMVGATKAFIRKPFVKRSIILGLIGSILAVICLIGVLIYVNINFPTLEIFKDTGLTTLVLLSVLVVEG